MAGSHMDVRGDPSTSCHRSLLWEVSVEGEELQMEQHTKPDRRLLKEN